MPITVTIRTEADLEATWTRISDITRWPEWNPACGDVETDGAPIMAGSRLKLQLRHPRGRLFWTEPRITTLEPPHELSWIVRSFGVRAPLTILCEELPSGGTAVTLTARSRGILGFAYRLVFPEKTQGLVWSGTLTALAQSLRAPRTAERSAGSRRPR